MVVIYLDLNHHPDPSQEHTESYILNARKYGGASQPAKYLLDRYDDFYIFASEKSFEGVSDRLKPHCFFTTPDQRKAIRDGAVVENVLPKIKELNPQILFHHHVEIQLNTKYKNGAWSIGFGEHCKQKEALFLYNEFQNPQIYVHPKNVYKVVLGKEIKPFEYKQKENFIFQCSRHCESFNTKWINFICTKNKIPFFFAGPKDQGYEILENDYCKYLGILNEEEKLHYYSLSICSPLVHSWPTPFSLSAIEALSCNTPLIVADVGFWRSLIEPGINGFYVRDEESFISAYYKCKELDQRKIYETCLPYSIDNMLNSFYAAFQDIISQ